MAAFWINLLDMGSYSYGDSIFINHPDVRILIDGGYAGLATGSHTSPSIPSQLQAILGHEPPFEIDLLVVTHCHGDHVGALPRLVDEGVLRPEWALVADPDLAFGPFDGGILPDAPSFDLLAVALREEPHDELPDAELLDFLFDAVTLEDRYRGMLDQLDDGPTRVVRYGTDDLQELEDHFGPLGLEILGPSREHLHICSRQLREILSDGVARIGAPGVVLPDGPLSPSEQVMLYRRLVSPDPTDSVLAVDASGKGAALNCQSIVLLFESDGGKALLTGDMQLSDPSVPGLDDSMEELLQTLAERAPFDLLKTPHHSSFNGLDDAVYQALPAAVYGHTGGRGSDHHPSRRVLDLLESHQSTLRWVRTDRNGRIGIRLGDGEPRLFLRRGDPNDFRPPIPADEAPVVEIPRAPSPEPATASRPPSPQRPAVSETTTADAVEITARIPHRATRVILTVDVQPGAGEGQVEWSQNPQSPRLPADSSAEPLHLAGGRPLFRLLFVTSPRLLEVLGQTEGRKLLESLRDAGHPVLDSLPSDPESAPEAVAATRQYLRSLAEDDLPAGVVLLGNYDVIPATALDVLGDELRTTIDFVDHDRFLVWSDDAYGDLDGDGVPELPVSRIPHGSGDLLRTALTAAGPPDMPGRFGICNVHRPFGHDVFDLLSGEEALMVSGPATRHDLTPASEPGTGHYFMLHGTALDATTFWGEPEDEAGAAEIEAFHLDDVPERFSGTVFSGCCWGALPVTKPAAWRAPGEPVQARTERDSIALRYLAAGAWAFVGCTGSHYSPGSPPFNYFGAPFHQVFWHHLEKSHPPAKALFETKRLYGASIPHLQGSLDYTAIELKLLQQFTCLGLGW